jgi:hypothetical protein
MEGVAYTTLKEKKIGGISYSVHLEELNYKGTEGVVYMHVQKCNTGRL